MRLDKLIETSLHTSRKELKRLFLRGQVLIDGQVERKENRNVDSNFHQIEVAGKTLTTQEAYFLMNKPSGVVTANGDANHQTVVDLLAPADQLPTIFSVGRLDRDTEGLVFLTTNGQLGYQLMQPKSKVAKVYQALINEQVTLADVAAFKGGIVFTGGVVCKPADLEILWYDEKNHQTTVRLTIREGKFHQVKKMFLARGKKVIALKREKIGPLSLPADLASGAYRRLSSSELQELKAYFK